MNILLLIVVYRIVYIEREGLGRQAGRQGVQGNIFLCR